MEVAKSHKDVMRMKISEARQVYSAQIKAYQEQKLILSKQRQELEKKINNTPNGQELFANEAAILDLTYNAVNEKQTAYQEYMSKLTEQWAAQVNALSAKQQGDAMAEYAEDIGKIMEVARRIMKGHVVPASDERKLMEYSNELYQSAKNIGAMVKQKEKKKYDSLWEEEEEKVYEDPVEAADHAEAFADGPEIVDVADTMASVGEME